jgi:hypothetical protein
MYNNIFRKSCRLRDDVEEYGGAALVTDNIILRMLFACWITKARYALRICNTYAFPQ